MSVPKIIIERGRHGLWYATSPDIPSLFVAETDEASLREVLAHVLDGPVEVEG